MCLGVEWRVGMLTMGDWGEMDTWHWDSPLCALSFHFDHQGKNVGFLVIKTSSRCNLIPQKILVLVVLREGRCLLILFLKGWVSFPWVRHINLLCCQVVLCWLFAESRGFEYIVCYPEDVVSRRWIFIFYILLILMVSYFITFGIGAPGRTSYLKKYS